MPNTTPVAQNHARIYEFDACGPAFDDSNDFVRMEFQ
jgi:hypothetical protein